MQQGSMTA